jgi:hypothetical protein
MILSGRRETQNKKPEARQDREFLQRYHFPQVKHEQLYTVRDTHIFFNVNSSNTNATETKLVKNPYTVNIYTYHIFGNTQTMRKQEPIVDLIKE